MPSGTVKYFDEARRCGLISTADGEELWVLPMGLKSGTRTLKAGQQVRYQPKVGITGRVEATDVVVVEPQGYQPRVIPNSASSSNALAIALK